MRLFYPDNFFIITEDHFRNESLEYIFEHPQMFFFIPSSLHFFFRKHNILFITPCHTTATIDTYYKGIAYALLYKSSGSPVDSISINDVTLTLVCYGYPLALVQHLQDRKYTITEITSGVFNIQKELMLPILLINIPELPAHEYAWVTNIGPAPPKISNECVPAYALDSLKPTFYNHKIRRFYNGHLRIFKCSSKNYLQ